MESIYEQELLLGSEHVDRFRRLRTSMLFTLFQSASVRHAEALGLTGQMPERGLFWVVARQRALVERMPEYGERVLLRTWPGKTKRVIFPRHYELVSAHGETLVRASALWSLMESGTRSIAFPDEHGVEIAGVETGRELACHTRIEPLAAAERFDFTVPNSYVDLNGHMNNARYFDLAEDRLPAVNEGKMLREARIDYLGEVPLGATLHVAWGNNKDKYYVNGETNRLCFRMELVYAEAGRSRRAERGG